MRVSIIIHMTKTEDSKKWSKRIEEVLELHHPNKVSIYYSGAVIIVDHMIHLEFRCGDKMEKFGGVIPDYYYTDDEGDIRMMLEMGASKVNGIQFKNLYDVIKIVNTHMDSYYEIKEYLKAKGCVLSYDRN